MPDKKYKILVAEDDRFLIKAFKDKLEREGFIVVVASDGDEALSQIEKEKPDIVLLDLIMPVKNGFEVLSEMKLKEDSKRIPVIILSNLGQEPDIKKGLDLGAVDYLIKSDFPIKAVVEKIKEHLIRAKAKK